MQQLNGDGAFAGKLVEIRLEIQSSVSWKGAFCFDANKTLAELAQLKWPRGEVRKGRITVIITRGAVWQPCVAGGGKFILTQWHVHTLADRSTTNLFFSGCRKSNVIFLDVWTLLNRFNLSVKKLIRTAGRWKHHYRRNWLFRGSSLVPPLHKNKTKTTNCTPPKFKRHLYMYYYLLL